MSTGQRAWQIIQLPASHRHQTQTFQTQGSESIHERRIDQLNGNGTWEQDTKEKENIERETSENRLWKTLKRGEMREMMNH